eukprot:2079023-Pyramimonas_sp.AAC.2
MAENILATVVGGDKSEAPLVPPARDSLLAVSPAPARRARSARRAGTRVAAKAIHTARVRKVRQY